MYIPHPEAGVEGAVDHALGVQLEDARGRRRAEALRADVVLERHRDAVQRTDRRGHRVECARAGAGPLGQHRVERVEGGARGVDIRDARDVAVAWAPYCSVATWYIWRSLDPLPVTY